ncbi:hypothetical protein JCM6882_008363 [Rhodosporidiobolus microsporus]
MDTVKGTHYVLHPWAQVFTPWFEQLYSTVIDEVKKVAAHPQTMRVLEQEADVGDVVFANILQPVVEILNQMIRPEFKDRLEITIQHQASETLSTHVWDEVEDRFIEKSVAIRVDHAIVLVPRSGAQGRFAQQDFARSYLLIIEEKRYGYVDGPEWVPPRGMSRDLHQKTPDDYFERDNLTAHLDQLTLYMGHFNCEHFLLTDYKDGIAIHLTETGEEDDNKPIIRLSPRPCDRRFKSPYSGNSSIKGPEGLRHAACTLAMHAMHELQILNTASLSFVLPLFCYSL